MAEHSAVAVVVAVLLSASILRTLRAPAEMEGMGALAVVAVVVLQAYSYLVTNNLLLLELLVLQEQEALPLATEATEVLQMGKGAAAQDSGVPFSSKQME